MVREGWTLRRVTDPEALAWEEHHAWQALPIGERLPISMEMNRAVYAFYHRQHAIVRDVNDQDLMDVKNLRKFL